MNEEFPYLDEKRIFEFPDIENTTPEGIVGVGGNLSPGMLLSAYSQGIFPWYSPGEPILWWSPDPRYVLFPEKIHIQRSLRKILKKDHFTYTFDKSFRKVISRCAIAERPGQNGTWITEEMIKGYSILNELGYAHSMEIWAGDCLAGGLYGVSLGDIFFGESMFTEQDNASKAGFVMLVTLLSREGFLLIDSQVYTSHLERFGAEEIPRNEYMDVLNKALKGRTRKGNWGLMFDEKINSISFS